MKPYILYNNDAACARFTFDQGMICSYAPAVPELLPMQIRSCGAEGFTLWLRERAIDLNTLQHRRMAEALLGSRDKLTLALQTNMFSISDTFTCFPEDQFIPREQLCRPEDQEPFSSFILISSDTSLRRAHAVSPNISTDGSFPKTWKYEDGGWWLYKLQASDATKSEVYISRALRACGWDAAEYAFAGSYRKRVRTKNFLGRNEFFEPYDSFRFLFADKSDGDDVIMRNLSSLGGAFQSAWKRILAADAFFMNTDRHMRNFGVIRSSDDGRLLRLAPNFDNNQAYRANPGGYSDGMLRLFLKTADAEDQSNIASLREACAGIPYLREAYQAQQYS